jgi:adenylate cyclase
LLLSTVVSLVWFSTADFTQQNTALIQQLNANSASDVATQARQLFEFLTEKMRLLGTVSFQDFRSAGQKELLLSQFFASDKDLLAVFVFENRKTGPVVETRVINPELGRLNDPSGDGMLATLSHDPHFSVPEVAAGDVQITTVNLADGTYALALAIPFVENPLETQRFTHSLVAAVRQNRFFRDASEDSDVSRFIVDRHGRLVAHSEPSSITPGEMVSHLEIVKQLLTGKFGNGETRYVDPQTHQARLGAFRVVGFGGLGVVAEVPEAKSVEVAHRVRYRALCLAIVILSLSFLTGLIYSRTITWPIENLVEAAHHITEGDFRVQLQVRGQDEVARLSCAFNEMVHGLEERDRVKEVFHKFYNKEIAKKLLSGEVKLGGELRRGTILFNDIRQFAQLSESLAPEETVEMLNEYFNRMVAIILAHGGIVHKFMGDAIMAFWGIPVEGKDDSLRALAACLAMRQELVSLNQARHERGKPVLRIGMGLNEGNVIAGYMGSAAMMEYTVIGDTVNLAARIESLTKEYGTDLLVSASVAGNVKDKFIFEPCQTVRVKGKKQAVEIFKVRGYVREDGHRVIIETPYSQFTPGLEKDGEREVA